MRKGIFILGSVTTILGVIALAIVFNQKVPVYFNGYLVRYESLGSEFFALAGLMFSAGIFITIYSFIASTPVIKQSNRCLNCGNPILDSYVACPHCGTSLKIKCPACGQENKAEWVTCPYCGHNYGAPSLSNVEMGIKEEGAPKVVNEVKPFKEKTAPRVSYLLFALGILMLVVYYMVEVLVGPARSLEFFLILMLDVLAGITLIAFSFILPYLDKRRANST